MEGLSKSAASAFFNHYYEVDFNLLIPGGQESSGISWYLWKRVVSRQVSTSLIKDSLEGPSKRAVFALFNHYYEVDFNLLVSGEQERSGILVVHLKKGHETGLNKAEQDPSSGPSKRAAFTLFNHYYMVDFNLLFSGESERSDMLLIPLEKGLETGLDDTISYRFSDLIYLKPRDLQERIHTQNPWTKSHRDLPRT